MSRRPMISGRVFTIILNWNGWRDTLACVRSCQGLMNVDNELIVVDNGSTDGSVARLREAIPDLRIIETGANLGYAGGNNVGIRLALDEGAEFVWLLNNDTTVDPRALDELVAAMRSHHRAGMVGSKICYADRPEVLWFAGGYCRPDYGWAMHRGQDEVDTGQYDEIGPAEFITGCSLLVRRGTLADIGGLDEGYFLYWEDVDWCVAAASAGWGIIYAPGSRVWHKVGGSGTGGIDLLQVRYDTRNRIRFHRRHRPTRLARIRWWAARHALGMLRRRDTRRQGRAMMRGVIDSLLGQSGPIEAGRPAPVPAATGRSAAAGGTGDRDDDIRTVHDGIQRLERLYLGLLNRPPTVRELWGSWSAISSRSGMVRKLLSVGLSREARSQSGWMGRLLRTADQSPSAPAIARRLVTLPAIRGLEFLERWRPGIAACDRWEPAHGLESPDPSRAGDDEVGFTLVGYLKADCGLGEAARSLARACVAVGTPLAAVDVGYQIPCRHTDDSVVLPPVSCPPPVDLLYVNADQTLATRQSLLAQGHTEGRYTIGFWHWEQPEIPRRHHAAFSELDEVWVPSTFVQDAVVAVSPVPVFKVPHAVSVVPSAGASRERFGLPSDRQLVLVMYDFNSFQERKNPQAAIAAYRLAAAQSPSLGLVVKTHNSAANPEALAEVRACLADLPGVTFIDETLSRQETWDLESCCDILLSLHRAEGFGFGPAEMMALGKPVVATGWSANMDFMNATNSMPVRYELKPLEKTVGPYDAGPLWADADTEHAAWCLGQLATDPALAARIGACARATIRESFDPLVVGRRVRDRLATIARWHPEWARRD